MVLCIIFLFYHISSMVGVSSEKYILSTGLYTARLELATPIHLPDKLYSFRALAFELFGSKFRHLVYKPGGGEFDPHKMHLHYIRSTGTGSSCVLYNMYFSGERSITDEI